MRDYHPTSGLRVILREGKMHQARRMTAAIDYLTLRLVRIAIGNLTIGDLQPGEWRKLSEHEIRGLMQ